MLRFPNGHVCSNPEEATSVLQDHFVKIFSPEPTEPLPTIVTDRSVSSLEHVAISPDRVGALF